MAIVVAREAAAEEPAGDEDEDDANVAAGSAPSGSGSSSMRLFTGLFEGQSSFVEYTPDPRIASYILSSRKRGLEITAKQTLPKRRRSIRQSASTGNVLVGEHVLALFWVVLLAFVCSVC